MKYLKFLLLFFCFSSKAHEVYNKDRFAFPPPTIISFGVLSCSAPGDYDHTRTTRRWLASVSLVPLKPRRPVLGVGWLIPVAVKFRPTVFSVSVLTNLLVLIVETKVLVHIKDGVWLGGGIQFFARSEDRNAAGLLSLEYMFSQEGGALKMSGSVAPMFGNGFGSRKSGD
jgi:hypothetical protein